MVPVPAGPEDRGQHPQPLPVSKAEERYRTLFETMLHGVVYQDAEGVIVAVNPAAADILGAPADALIGLRSDDPSWQSTRTAPPSPAPNTRPCRHCAPQRSCGTS